MTPTLSTTFIQYIGGRWRDLWVWGDEIPSGEMDSPFWNRPWRTDKKTISNLKREASLNDLETISRRLIKHLKSFLSLPLTFLYGWKVVDD